jgi:hypothetical protein
MRTDTEKAMETIEWRESWTEEVTDNGVRVLALGPAFTPTVAERLAERISALAASGEDAFVIDLVEVQAMDPRAMASVIGVSRALRSAGSRVSVVFDPLLQLFCAEGLEDLYDVAVTREDAVAGIARRDPAASSQHSS